jgi:hypothetical protein
MLRVSSVAALCSEREKFTPETFAIARHVHFLRPNWNRYYPVVLIWENHKTNFRIVQVRMRIEKKFQEK